MRILDFDLDFFANDIAHFRSDFGERVDSSEIQPWAEKDFREFLETRCGLSKRNKVHGRVVKHHNEAFYFWRDLIKNNQLKEPFKVIHIDAHADLGLGDASWAFIMTNLLHRKPEKRLHPERIRYESKYHKFGPGNYLAYAIACRWVSSLIFVTHPNWDNDIQPMILKDFDDDSGFIQLRKYPKEIDTFRLKGINPIELEPEVPFSIIPSSEFVNDDKEVIAVLAQSPGYTPVESDKLIPIFMEYIECI